VIRSLVLLSVALFGGALTIMALAGEGIAVWLAAAGEHILAVAEQHMARRN
jgi:uncharacterized membrane protein